MKNEVTIILATYNRPDSLEAAIKSVINQSLTHWQLLVIGDNCDKRTADVIKNNLDSRITYLNLPDRFGEQSGPNSVGLSLVNTPYVSYLNHDDIWLADHLEVGIETLKKRDVDFYIGGTAYSKYIDFSTKTPELLVNEINTDKRSPIDFFAKNTAKYEPASSWIIKNEFAKKIGFWNYYTDLYRVPIEDYLMRAWRIQCKFHFSSKITTWAIATQYLNDTSRKAYEYNSKEHKEVIKQVVSNTPNTIRNILYQKHSEWKSMPKNKKNSITNHYYVSYAKGIKKLLKKLLLNKLAAQIYLVLGIDVFTITSILRGKRKGFSIRKTIKIRTGDAPPKPNLQSVIQRVHKGQVSFLES